MRLARFNGIRKKASSVPLPEKTPEPPFNPDLAVIDSHTHLWNAQGYDYFAPELLADIAASGHRVEATVYAECDMNYRADGPAAMRPVGETEHAVRQARLAEGASTRINSAIMGASDLRLGAGIEPVMEAHLQAGAGRFRGIRWRGAWDPDPAAAYQDHSYPSADILGDPAIVEGARTLARMGLVLSVWIFHPQLDAFTAIARQVPDLPIALNHSGGRLGVGGWAARQGEARQEWTAAMRRAAECPNLHIQIGGIGVSRSGYLPGDGLAGSDRIVADWKDEVDFMLECFGPGRAIFDSNFPVDRRLTAYGTYINAFKKMLAGYSADEQRAVMSETARRFFRL